MFICIYKDRGYSVSPLSPQELVGPFLPPGPQRRVGTNKGPDTTPGPLQCLSGTVWVLYSQTGILSTHQMLATPIPVPPTTSPWPWLSVTAALQTAGSKAEYWMWNRSLLECGFEFLLGWETLMSRGTQTIEKYRTINIIPLCPAEKFT